MSTTLKVLSAKKVISKYKIADGETLTIKASKNVNYQLIDDQTGVAPQKIIAKRVGNDLQILLENGDQVPDIVITDYYTDTTAESTNLLVGQHENGKVYVYVPTSGEKADAISVLLNNQAEPQVLGGDERDGAFWVFSPWWLLALIPVAGIAIAAGSGGGSGSSNDAPADTSADKPSIDAQKGGKVIVAPGADNTKLVVEYTDENGDQKTITVNKGSDGSWTSEDTLPNGVTLDPSTGTITLAPEAVKDKTTVTATGTDAANNSSSVTSTAQVDDSTPDQADKPNVDTQNNGQVVVKPGEDNTKLVIEYTNEDGESKTIILNKDSDTGNWTSEENLPSGVTLDPTTGKVTLPPDEVKDETTITATGTDPYNNKSKETKTSKIDGVSGAPSLSIPDAADGYINAQEIKDGV
ncbi:putative Ig domain-containing protein, partial [Volucribacter psittacicida]|uniref:putative Ig domain-containing protein n=1 Tax=Volucribacter psittacicida TaxID=203482 RepID=UPI001FB2BFA5